ncbi:MAG TPA: ATP-binding protein [Longimicrobiales bacterium]|nr:ATP-binding protein [Longimicrobiales bacterium]
MEHPSHLRLLAAAVALSGALWSHPAAGQMRFDPRFRADVWTTDDGLAGQAVTALAQAGDGYLWLIASGAVTRFDGLNFRTFHTGEAGLPAGRPLSLAVARGDTVWVSFSDDAETTVARYTDGTFAVLFTVPGIWRQLARDGNGTLWLGGTLVMAPVEDGVPGETVSIGLNIAAYGYGRELGPSVWRDRFGDLWTRDDETRSLLRVSPAGAWLAGPAHAPVLLTRPSSGDILFTEVRDGQVAVLDRDGSIVASYRDAAGAVPHLVDRRGRLWVADTEGLAVYRGDSDVPVTRLEIPAAADLTELAEDRQGNLWGRTVTSGLIRIRELPTQVVGAPEGIRARQVLNLAAAPDGSVLASDRDGRAYRIGSRGVEVVYEFGDHEGSFGVLGGAYGLAEDRRGRMWFGTVGRPGQTGRHLVGKRNGTPDVVVPVRFGINAIAEDPRGDGTIWFGGVQLYRGRLTDSGVELVDSILFATEDLRSLAFDAQGTLWIPVDEGLARIDEAGLTMVRSPDYPGRAARSALVDHQGTLWIGTYRHGLLRYRDGAFSAVTEAQGLFEDVTSTLLEDDFGNLWMAGNRSIHRAAIRDLNAVLDGEMEGLTGVGYSRDDGIPNPETSGYTAAKDGEGRLWFPTFDGAVVIDPAAIFDLDAGPLEVYVEGVRIGDRSVPRDRDAEGSGGGAAIRLDAHERRFDVDFTAIDLRDAGGLRFRYILEGFDEGWTDAGEARTATYTNVNGGTYTFRVRALSGAGVESGEASLGIAVSPYFYETPPFLAFLGLALVGGMVLLFRHRERQGLARQAYLNEVVRERTRELSEASARAEEALEVAGAQAERLESLVRDRSRFFANVSHEFRTPLTLMVGPLRDLKHGRLGALSKEAEEEIGVVLESGERLALLVEQLLDIARLEVGELRLDPVRVDLLPLLRGVARSFAALARARDIHFEANLPAGPVVFSHDPDHLAKVLNNILGNAFKFTNAHGRVALTAAVKPDSQVLSVIVEDSGVGIPAEAIDRVFDRFYQADDSAKRRYQGAGVGLSLTRELVELHGGTIDLRSRLGQGTVVEVRLPLTEMDGDPPPEAGTTEPLRSGVGLMVGGSLAQPPDPATEDVTTILLVEDEPRLRAYLRRHLETEYRVVEASDGAAALEETLRLVPDLIISDVMMPKMDGEELVAAIRANPDVAFLPVILLTARASHGDMLSGLRGGADDYITKPFDVEEVMLRVRNLIGSRRRFRSRLEAEGIVTPSLAPPEGRGGAAAAFAADLHAALVDGAGDEDFGVDALARELHMSRSVLYRKAQVLLGRAPMEVVWDFRLDQAAQWLRETDLRVNEIAYGVGFKSVPHFSRKFRDRFGETPSAYRER